MKSMTGYGYKEGGSEILHFSVELKSYNNRFLDIYVNLPLAISPLESRVREFLLDRIQRGKVEVYIKMKETQEHLRVTVDEGVVKGYLQALRKLVSYADAPEEIRLSHLLRLEGILQVEKSRDIEEYWKELRPLLDETFASFDASRIREGEALEKDVLHLLEKIEAEVQSIEGRLPELKRFFTETIRARMEELLGDQVDEGRILSEVAVLLVKYSVNEELVRLKAHIEAFRKILKEEGGIGKKLDFLCQEMNREINTVGSKNVLADVTRSVVEMKEALENIREQIRNIE